MASRRVAFGGWLAAWATLTIVFAAQDNTSRMEQVVRSYLSDKQFMGSVLVIRDKTVLFNKGYGSAHLEWDIPNSPTTKFRIGSLTKQFTAACILLLEERAKLKVDDPIKKYMPDAPATWDKVTIFSLLSHTSGIPNFTEFRITVQRKLLQLVQKNSFYAFATNRLNFNRARTSATATPDTFCWGT